MTQRIGLGLAALALIALGAFVAQFVLDRAPPGRLGEETSNRSGSEGEQPVLEGSPHGLHRPEQGGASEGSEGGATSAPALEVVRISGVVLDAETLRAVRSAAVELVSTHGSEGAGRGRTDDHGRFEFAAQVRHTEQFTRLYFARALVDGQDARQGTALLKEEPVRWHYFTVVLVQQCGWVHGRVVATPGRDVTGVRVQLTEARDTSGETDAPIRDLVQIVPLVRFVTPLPTGEFHAAVRPGRVFAALFDEEKVGEAPAFADVAAGQRVDLGELRQDESQPITISVTGDDGASLPGAFAIVEHPNVYPFFSDEKHPGTLGGSVFADEGGVIKIGNPGSTNEISVVVGAPLHEPRTVSLERASTSLVQLRALPQIEVSIDPVSVAGMDWRIVERVGVAWRDARGSPVPVLPRRIGVPSGEERARNMIHALGAKREGDGGLWRMARVPAATGEASVYLRGGHVVRAPFAVTTPEGVVRVRVVLPKGRVCAVSAAAAPAEEPAGGLPVPRATLQMSGSTWTAGPWPMGAVVGRHEALFVPEDATGAKLLPDPLWSGSFDELVVLFPPGQDLVDVEIRMRDPVATGLREVTFLVMLEDVQVDWARLVVAELGNAGSRKSVGVSSTGADRKLRAFLPSGRYACHVYAGSKLVFREDIEVGASAHQSIELRPPLR